MKNNIAMINANNGYTRIYKLTEFLILFAMIIVSSDTVLFGTNENTLLVNLKYIFIATLILIYMRPAISSSSKRSSETTILAIMTLLLVITAILCDDLRGGYVLRFMLIIAAFCYTASIPRITFMQMFSDAIFIIGLYSLACYVVNFISPDLFSIFPVLTNISGLEFRNLILCNIPINYSVDRLWGPFSEPGVFQIMLNTAMLFDIYLRKDLNYFRIGIFTAAVILSKSTTGYFTLAMVLAFLVTCSRGQSGSRSRVIIILLLTIALGILVQHTDLLSAEGVVFDKLHDTQRSSTAARLASITCNLQMFAMSPIWGVGLTAADELFPKLASVAVGVFTGSNTNQLLFQFASMGIFYGLIWTIGVAKFFNKLGASQISRIILFMIFILLCVGENLNWSILFYLFIFYGFQNNTARV